MRAAVAAGFFLALSVPGAALPCAPAPPPGLHVAIAEESAIVVYDREKRIEHFIRRATFHTHAKDFGFLVPTPDKPELAEAPDAAFAQLEDVIRPAIVHDEPLFEPTAFCAGFWLLRGASAPASAPPPVRVLEEKRVAGYDAAVLEADDAGALARWLGDHGYASRPALVDWLAPYVAKRWKLTAFKIAGAGGEAVATGAVRMSFATDRPFFPYREPADQREGETGPRLLRVFYLGDARADGAVGDAGTPWPGKAVWSSDADRLASIVAPLVPAGSLAPTPWMTVFEDASSPRPGTDEVYFAAAKSADRVVPAPIVMRGHGRIPVPIDLLVIASAVGYVIWRRRRRAR